MGPFVAGAVIMAVVIGLLGYLLGSVREYNDKLRELGLDRGTVKLFKRARDIFLRMIEIRELDGDNAIDALSVNTDKQVREWLADYRKKVEKG